MLKHTRTGSLNPIVMPIYAKAVSFIWFILKASAWETLVVTERWSVHDSTYVSSYTYFSICFTSPKASETTSKYK